MAEKSLHLIVISDVHGKYLSEDGFDQANKAGLDRLSTYLKELRSQGKAVLLVDNGDTLQGHPLVDWHDFSGEYNRLDHPTSITDQVLKTDIFIPGNHEFNFGVKHLLKIESLCHSKWLSCNIFWKCSGKHLFDPYQIMDFGEFKIGVIGAVTDFVPKWENPAHIEELEFKPVLESIREPVEFLRDQVDLLVVSYHGGLEQKPCLEERSNGEVRENIGCELMRRFPEIDILITGHQHEQILQKAGKNMQSLIFQPGSHGKFWGEIRIEAGNGKLKIDPDKARITSALDYKADSALQSQLEAHTSLMLKNMNRKIGHVQNGFAVTKPMEEVWLKKHPLIQWQNNILLKVTGADIAASPLLDATHPGLSGAVTVKDLFRVYPYPNSPVVMKINGAILKDAMELAASFFSMDDQRNISVSKDWKKDNRVRSYDYDIWDGIEYEMNLSKEPGERITSIIFKGDELKPEQELTLAVSSYRSAGAFYQMYSREKVIDEYPDTMMYLMKQDLAESDGLPVEPIQNFKIISE